MRKIAFWRTVGAALRVTFGDRSRLLHVLEPRLIVTLLALIAGEVLEALLHLNLLLVLAASWVVVLLAFASFAVAWHRAILMGMPQVAADGWRIGPREWRFLGYSLAIPLLVGLPLGIGASLATVVVMVAGRLAGLSGLALALLEPSVRLAAVLLGAACAARLALVLPAVAIDEPGASLRQAWARGRGNALRLAGGSLLCLASFAPIVLLYLALLERIAADSLALQLVLALGLMALEFLDFAVAVAFLSLAYDQLRAPAE
ncbi:MAG: hypothetical protein ACLQJR_35230 [Stellaceae bacterium]